MSIPRGAFQFIRGYIAVCVAFAPLLNSIVTPDLYELEASKTRRITAMKTSLPLVFLTTFAVISCEEEPPVRTHHHVARYPAAPVEQYPPQQQPFNPDAQAPPPPDNPVPVESPTPAATAAPVKTTTWRYSLWHSGAEQARLCHQSVCAESGLCGCARFSSGNRGERSVHEQDLSCSVISESFAAGLALRFRKLLRRLLDNAAQYWMLVVARFRKF